MTFIAAAGLVLTILGLMGWSAFGMPAHFVGITFDSHCFDLVYL